MGGILAEARHVVGLSLEQVDELTGGAVNARVLCAIERGRRRVADAELAVLTRIYGLDPASLTPRRPQFRVDLVRGIIFQGDTEYRLTGDARAPAAVVADYLAMVREARGSDISSPIALRSADLATLGETLGQDRATLRTQLRTSIEGARSMTLAVWSGPEHRSAAADADERIEVESTPGFVADTTPDTTADTTMCTELATVGTTEVELHNEVRSLESDVMAELESVYDEIAVLSSRRYHLGKRRYRRRHQDLLAREQALLNTLGFESWSMLIIGIASGQATLLGSAVEPTPIVDTPSPPVVEAMRELDIPRPVGAHFRVEPAVAMRTSWSEFVSVRVDGSPLGTVEVGVAEPTPADGFRAQFSNESLFVHRAASAVDGPAE